MVVRTTSTQILVYVCARLCGGETIYTIYIVIAISDDVSS